MVELLPQPSVAVQVLVTEKLQPLPDSGESVNDAARPVEQLSVTDAVPNAAAISEVVGLQFSVDAAVTVITGACTSLVNAKVCDAVAVLPQPSVVVQVLVTVKLQPVPVSVPSIKLAVSPVEQLSV